MEALSLLSHPDRSVRQQAAEGVTAGLSTRTPDTGLRVQHTAARQVDQRSPARLQHLDLIPQPRQRGLRRIGQRPD